MDHSEYGAPSAEHPASDLEHFEGERPGAEYPATDTGLPEPGDAGPPSRNDGSTLGTPYSVLRIPSITRPPVSWVPHHFRQRRRLDTAW